MTPMSGITELRRALEDGKIMDHIRAVVASAPPLTQAQKDRLAMLLGTDQAGQKT